MATRRETEAKKRRLKEDARRECGAGDLRPGSPLPPMTALAERYGLSINVVRAVVRELSAEGILYTVPRLGTFVGRPEPSARQVYALVLPGLPAPEHSFYRQTQFGFEGRLAQLGGSSVALSAETLRSWGASAEPLALAGLFDFTDSVPEASTWLPALTDATPDLARVVFTSRGALPPGADSVGFDDADGGQQAAVHLLRRGHRRVAFLALHPPNPTAESFDWSVERERGWSAALHAEGLATDDLAFHPAANPPPDRQTEAALLPALDVARRSEVTAVVTVNDYAAMALFQALHDLQRPAEQWPALVSFDDRLNAAGYFVTSLRLPWEELGRDAADLLWDRHHGRLTGPSQRREAPLRLVSRLTCRPRWTVAAGEAVLTGITRDWLSSFPSEITL